MSTNVSAHRRLLRPFIVVLLLMLVVPLGQLSSSGQELPNPDNPTAEVENPRQSQEPTRPDPTQLETVTPDPEDPTVTVPADDPTITPEVPPQDDPTVTPTAVEFPQLAPEPAPDDSTLIVDLYGCPEGVDPSTVPENEAATKCNQPLPPTSVTLTVSGVPVSTIDGVTGQGQAQWSPVSSAGRVVTLNPAPTGATSVYCVLQTPQGGLIGDNAWMENGSFTVPDGEGTMTCYAMLVVAAPTSTIVIEKYMCPKGYAGLVDDSLAPYVETCTEQPGEGSGISFTVSGPLQQAVTLPVNGAGVTFGNLTGTNFTITETIAPPAQTPSAVAWVCELRGTDTPATTVTKDVDPGMTIDVAPGSVTICRVFNIFPPEGTITIHKWQCPEGYDVTSAGANPAVDCTTPVDGVTFYRVAWAADSSAAVDPQVTGSAGLGTVEFKHLVLTESFDIAENAPDGTESSFTIGCVAGPNGFDGPVPNDATHQVTIKFPPRWSNINCDWYNVPGKPTTTVRVMKWICPGNVDVNMSSNEELMRNCTEPGNGVTFTRGTDGTGDSKVTADGQVEWTGVTRGPISIAETLPSDMSPTVRVVCGTAPIQVTGAVLAIDTSNARREVVCQWFNQRKPPAKLTIYKWECPAGYDVTAYGASPTDDCKKSLDGVNFTLADTDPSTVDVQTMTGDSVPGAVTFGSLPTDMYTITETMPAGYDSAFVWTCVGWHNGMVVPTPLAQGTTLNLPISAGDDITCHWFNVPTDPHGWIDVTKNYCETKTYTSDVDCEIFEQGVEVDLQQWDGSAWKTVATGITNSSGQIRFKGLEPGTYRVVEKELTPCHLTYSKVDAKKQNAIVEAGKPTTATIYNCGGRQYYTPPKKYPNTGVEPRGQDHRLPNDASLLPIIGAGLAWRGSRRRLIQGAAVMTGLIWGPNRAAAETCSQTATPSAIDTECERGKVPTHIAIEAIGVDAEIEVLEIVDGAMQQPTDEVRVAWYKDSARIGERGNMLLAGHLNWYGIPEAVFFHLAQLAVGDVILLTGEKGSEPVAYAVQWTKAFLSNEAPPEEAVGVTNEECLTLMTCSGSWDANRAQYDSRTVVRAVRTK